VELSGETVPRPVLRRADGWWDVVPGEHCLAVLALAPTPELGCQLTQSSGTAGTGRRRPPPEPTGTGGGDPRRAGGAAAGSSRAGCGCLPRGGWRPGGRAVLPERPGRRAGAAARCPVRRPPGRGDPAQPARTGGVLGARVLAEFGDDPHRYQTAKGRKAFASTAPVTRSSGYAPWWSPGRRATSGWWTPATCGRSRP
jgi:hypothetical protein